MPSGYSQMQFEKDVDELMSLINEYSLQDGGKK